MNIERIIIGRYNVIVHSECGDCLEVFIQKNFCFPEKSADKDINIYSFIKHGVVKHVIEDSKKIRHGSYNVYISHRKGGPEGIIIEKLDYGNICNYIIIAEDANAQIVLLRSVLIKIFFQANVLSGAFPIHCASVGHKDSGYLFIADSNGGKSTIYFSFASYSDAAVYSLMSDDTILCRLEDNQIVGSVMPLKPSLRKGTLKYVPQTECFANQFEIGYAIDDQIYVDVSKLKNSKTVLQNKIKSAFFINFSDAFCIKEIQDLQILKERIAIIVCRYKTTPIDERFLNFINNITNRVKFYNIFIPPNMKEFYDKFNAWLENGEESSCEENNKK